MCYVPWYRWWRWRVPLEKKRVRAREGGERGGEGHCIAAAADLNYGTYPTAVIGQNGRPNDALLVPWHPWPMGLAPVVKIESGAEWAAGICANVRGWTPANSQQAPAPT